MKRMILIFISKLLILLGALALVRSPCPCEYAADASTFSYHSLALQSFGHRSNHSQTPIILCLIHVAKSLDAGHAESLSSFELHGQGHIRLHVLKNGSDSTSCSAIVQISDMSIADSYNSRSLCPGRCYPVPEIVVPKDLIFQHTYSNLFDVHKDLAVTCTATVDMIFHKRQKMESSKHSKKQEIVHFLKEILIRRLQECFEHVKLSRLTRSHATPPTQSTRSLRESPPTNSMQEHAYSHRRKVKAVIIWIGTIDNLGLIEDQAVVLHGQPTSGMDAVIGWAATEDIYPCHENTTQCFGGNGKYRFLPHSAINVNKFGWRCAQRRPLRALAHVLQLLDPSFVVLVDDDTYVNYSLLVDRFGPLLFGEMQERPLFMGEFIGRTGVHGHLSTEGIFAGGSGYIFGHKLLQILTGKETRYFGFEGLGGEGIGDGESKRDLSDRYRSDPQIRHLSLLGEGLSLLGGTAKGSCLSSSHAGTAGCITIPQLVGNNHTSGTSKSPLFASIAVRLIDFCANIMAGEHTCHHRSSFSSLSSYSLCLTS